MSLVDLESMYSDQQAITTTDVSDNYVDFSQSRNTAVGRKAVKLFCRVNEAFVGGTSVQIQFQSATDSAFTSPTTHFETPAIATASLVAGYEFNLPAIPNTIDRYTRVRYVVVGTYTAGEVTTLIKDVTATD